LFEGSEQVTTLKPAVRVAGQHGADAIIVIAQDVGTRGYSTMAFAQGQSTTNFNASAYGNSIYGHANTTGNAWGSSFTMPNRQGRAACWRSSLSEAVEGRAFRASRSTAARMPPMKYWRVIADKLSAAGWTWGYCSAVTRDGWRWIVNAHRGDGRRYIVQSDELLTAFLELESNIGEFSASKTPTMIFKHYRELVRPRKGERYWQLQPARTQKIVPLVAR
jgi:hypothetical protein